jgi:hypothetical protein
MFSYIPKRIQYQVFVIHWSKMSSPPCYEADTNGTLDRHIENKRRRVRNKQAIRELITTFSNRKSSSGLTNLLIARLLRTLKGLRVLNRRQAPVKGLLLHL